MKKIFLLGIFLIALMSLTGLASANGDHNNSLNVGVSGPGKVNISVTKAGETSNYQCDRACQFVVQDDSQINLEPIANNGALFLGWEGICQRSQSTCALSIDPGIVGQVIEVEAKFAYQNSQKPFLKKISKLTSKKLMIRTGCGGDSKCSLKISGYLLGRKKIAIKPIYFDLQPRERRDINILNNKSLNKTIIKIGKKKSRARLFITVSDLLTNRSQSMAINEKPRCCWDKPNK